MKILYFCRVNRDDHKNYGVVKKCEAQAAAFRNLGMETDLIYLCKQGILKNEKTIHTFSYPFLSQRWSTYLFYFLFLLRIVFRKINPKEYQILYLRYAMTHPLLMWFFRKMKKSNPSLRIIVEIPTYPYDKEPRHLASKFSLIMDWWYRSKLTRFVDFIGHYGLEKEIYGIPVIPLRNGIRVESIKVSQSIPISGKLRLVGVANWSYWHGMDRLLKGLGDYYKEGKQETIVELKIIGGGKALEGYRELVESLNLQDYVEFIPPTIGLELDVHFDRADLGIGCLGIFRKGVKMDSSLKTREYCSRGLPFIFSGEDLDFSEECFFVKKVPHDETPVNLLEVVGFWKKLRENGLERKGERRLEIRNYAASNLTWEKQLQGMVRKMKGANKTIF